MNTHRETILRAVVANIRASVTTPCFRSRAEAFSRNELPAIVIKPGVEQADRLANRVVKRTFQVLIEIHARADSTPRFERTADQIADGVLAEVHTVLFADKTLGGVLADLMDKEMQEPQFADGDDTAVNVTSILEAVYATTEKDITKPFPN